MIPLAEVTTNLVIQNVIDAISLGSLYALPRPVFFIHATHGRGGEQLNPAYYKAAGQPKQLWQISDAGHMEGIKAHPQEYERRVISFFDRALLEAR